MLAQPAVAAPAAPVPSLLPMPPATRICCSSTAKRLGASGPFGGLSQLVWLLRLAMAGWYAVEDSRPATSALPPAAAPRQACVAASAAVPCATAAWSAAAHTGGRTRRIAAEARRSSRRQQAVRSRRRRRSSSSKCHHRPAKSPFGTCWSPAFLSPISNPLHAPP